MICSSDDVMDVEKEKSVLIPILMNLLQKQLVKNSTNQVKKRFRGSTGKKVTGNEREQKSIELLKKKRQKHQIVKKEWR
jgi:hypothetical protein